MPKSKGAGGKLSKRRTPGKYKEYITSESLSGIMLFFDRAFSA